MYDIISLDSKELSELREIGRQLNIPKVDKLEKQDLVYKILDHQALNPTEDVLEQEKNQVRRFRGRPKKNTDQPKQENPSAEPSEKPSFVPEDKPVFVPKDKPAFVPKDKPKFTAGDKPNFRHKDKPGFVPRERRSFVPKDRPLNQNNPVPEPQQQNPKPEAVKPVTEGFEFVPLPEAVNLFESYPEPVIEETKIEVPAAGGENQAAETDAPELNCEPKVTGTFSPGRPKKSPGKRVVISLRLSVNDPEAFICGRAFEMVSQRAILEASTSIFAEMTILLFTIAYSCASFRERVKSPLLVWAEITPAVSKTRNRTEKISFCFIRTKLFFTRRMELAC